MMRPPEGKVRIFAGRDDPPVATSTDVFASAPIAFLVPAPRPFPSVR